MKPNKELFQYDINQSLSGCTGKYIDFIINDDVFRVQVDNETCLIPDEMLQVEGDHTVYQTYEDGTISEHRLFVYGRPKPSDYVFTPTEKLTFDGLVSRVDDTVADMIRRADSGEFDGYTPVKGKDYFTESEIVQFKKDVTPKKGIDYFTDSEISQIQNEVSSGAIGEFRSVVQTETDNFNTNAQNKTAEFDSHTEQIQTDISGLKSDLTGLQTVVDSKADKSELAKTNLYLDALFKLNKGQTYDVLEQESEAYSVDVPSGAKYVGIDKVGGKSVVFEQIIKPENIKASKTENGITFTNNGDGTVTVSGTASANVCLSIGGNISMGSLKNKPFILTGCPKGGSSNTYYMGVGVTSDAFKWDKGDGYYKADGYEYGYELNIYIMSGAAIDTPITFKPNLFIINTSDFPSLDIFKQMFPDDYYEYCEPTIISSQTDRVDVVGFNQWDEEWEKILVSISNGNTAPSTTTIGSKNFCPILPSTAYYATCGKTDGGSQNKYYLGLIFYDENKQYISSGYYNNLVFTTPEKARFFKITTNTGTVIYGNTYNHDICINLSNPTRNGEYEPYSLQQIPTNFPVLNSAGSVYDYIALNEGKLHQRVGVVDLGTIDWEQGGNNNKTSWVPASWRTNVKPVEDTITKANILCDKYYTDTATNVEKQANDKTISVNTKSWVYIYDSAYVSVTPQEFKEAMSGVMLYYELAEEVITDIDIPTELSDWLTVEAGGSITFHNTDEGKRLLIPNKLSFVRKLDEVSV